MLQHINYEIALNYQYSGNQQLYIDFAKKAFYDYPSLSIAQIIALKLFQMHENQAAMRWIDESLSYAPTNAAKKSWIVSLSSLKNSIKQTDGSLKIVDKSHE